MRSRKDGRRERKREEKEGERMWTIKTSTTITIIKIIIITITNTITITITSHSQPFHSHANYSHMPTCQQDEPEGDLRLGPRDQSPAALAFPERSSRHGVGSTHSGQSKAVIVP